MNPFASFLRPIKRGKHAVEDYFHFRPLPGFEPREVLRGGFSSKVIVEELRKSGICKLERYLDPERLKACRMAWEEMLRSHGEPSPDTPAAIQIPFDCGKGGVLAGLVLDELILAAVENYYERPVYLVGGRAQRLSPIEPYTDKAFQWHHDAKGKYLKAMWLLNDVPVDGQRMSYIPGSHRQRRAFTTYQETRLTEQEARRTGPVFECAGPAGTVFIFDTNGIHRGNRNRGPIRDTVVGIYSAGRYRMGCSFEDGKLSHLSAWQKDVLSRSRKASLGILVRYPTCRVEAAPSAERPLS